MSTNMTVNVAVCAKGHRGRPTYVGGAKKPFCFTCAAEELAIRFPVEIIEEPFTWDTYTRIDDPHSEVRSRAEEILRSEDMMRDTKEK